MFEVYKMATHTLETKRGSWLRIKIGYTQKKIALAP